MPFDFSPQRDIVPPPDSASNVSLEALADLIQVLEDEGQLQRLPALARLFLAEIHRSILEALGYA